MSSKGGRLAKTIINDRICEEGWPIAACCQAEDIDGTPKSTLIGSRYAIAEDEPYIDNRIKSGDYIITRQKYPSVKNTEPDQKPMVRLAAARAARIVAGKE